MSAASKSRRIKLVFGVVIPVLVLVATIVMVSISFAWFSQETESSIQSINLSTQKAFVLEFENSKADNKNLEYMGQTALNADGFVYDQQNSLSYDKDMPFYFVTQLSINSAAENGVGKNIKLDLIDIQIKNGDSYFDYYNDEGGANIATEGLSVDRYHSNSNVPLAFTWFFKEHNNDDAPATNRVSESEKTMKSLLPTAGETWYTPYGTLKFKEVAGGEGSSNLITVDTVDNVAPADSTLPDKRTDYYIANFSTDGQQAFDFYIIFAPEIAYWSQFFTPISTTNTSKYDYAAQSEIFLGTSDGVNEQNAGTVVKQMYYSDMKYMGSIFSFKASLSIIG